ncbi:MAG: DUF4013 domain-containing protein [Minisyncoccales bacterium]
MKKLEFKKGIKYPFKRTKGLLNILWLFLPIFGWFALGGYGIRIIQEFSKGNFEKLPRFKFVDNMKLGFFMLIKSIPFSLAYIFFLVIVKEIINSSFAPNFYISIIELFIGLFIVPVLTINFLNKETVESYFEFNIILEVFNNLEDYVIALLKDFLLGLIFVFMFIILVGIPAALFTKSIFVADFYRRKIASNFTN